MATRDSSGYTQLDREDPNALDGKPNPNGDVVQFASAIYITDSDSGKIELDIMRIGQKTGTISFSYKTTAGSALPGIQYTETNGDVTLEPGIDEKRISVPILSDSAWNATKEFTVDIFNPGNCDLGLYLKTARVKVRDTSAFPDDTFKDYVSGENYEKLAGGEIELRNVYKYMHLILGVYMVDRVFNFDHDSSELLIPNNRLSTAYVIAACIVTPIILFYFLDRIVINMDTKGTLRGFMGRSLFRKYMNYNAQSHDSVTIAGQIGTLTGDVSAVTDGYLTLCSMGKLVGKIGISIFFTLQQNPDAWWAVVVIPSLMFLWCLCRTRTYVTALDASDETDESRTAFAQEVLTKMNLVAAYAQRPQMNEIFSAKTEDIKKVRIPEWQIILTNTFVPEALGPTMVAIYTAIGAELVLKGDLKLGVYLATISVFGDICDSFSQLFGKLMDIISTFTGLKGMFQLLNLQTDLVAVQEMSRKKQEMTLEMRHKLKDLPAGEGYVPRVDRLELKVIDVHFTYPGADEPVFKGLNYSCEQGMIIGIQGNSGQGRKTLMELLSMGVFPSQGTVFIPSHLRTLYVSRELVLLNLSVWQNLTFGNRRGNDPNRVEAILNHFEMKEVLKMCKHDLDHRRKEIENQKMGIGEQEKEEEDEENVGGGANALDKLREGTKAHIHLARAFIMNPEVLVMHRPFVHHHGRKNYNLLKDALQQHKANRGFKMDESKKARRRPRTIFFSADQQNVLLDNADIAWKLPKTVGGECTQGLVDALTSSKSKQESVAGSVAGDDDADSDEF